MLSDAEDRSDWTEVVLVACWNDVLEVIDRWIERAAPAELESQLLQIERRSAAERFECLRKVVPDLSAWAPSPRRRAADNACEAVRQSAAPSDACRAVRETFDALDVDDPGCTLMIDHLVEAVRSAGNALAVPTHEGALPIQRAVRLLDQRLHARLELLPSQIAWLSRCDDVWTEPGAMVVVSGIVVDSNRRGALAALAAQAFWSEADPEVRAAVQSCVQAVEHGTDDATTHAELQAIRLQRADEPVLESALKAIGWPADSLARLHWSPPEGVWVESGRLLERLRARHHAAARRDGWAWKRRSAEVEAAAESVLATLRARGAAE